VRAADRARAGAVLGALVAAHAPALKVLAVPRCALGDEGLGPLVDALAANTHLRELDCSNNGISETFVLNRLQPALLDGTSLRCLTLAEAGVVSPALRQLELLVTQRAAARDALEAAAAAAVP
jgi:hypothetical protein